MVIISNSPLDTAALEEKYKPNNVEKEIINTLSSSDKKYYYDSLDEFVFELRLRNEIVKSAIELDKSQLGFAVFRKSKCNEAYWERTQEGGFVLKNGAKPSDAIGDIYLNSSKYATECATAMMIIYYKALLNIYPEELFNKVFPKIHLMNWHYIDKLLKEVGYMRKRSDYLLGDRRYFSNPDVDPLTPQWKGENVIDLNGELYYGHGIGIHNAKTIIRVLNDNRKDGAQQSAYLLDSAGRPNFKNLYDIYYKFQNPSI